MIITIYLLKNSYLVDLCNTFFIPTKFKKSNNSNTFWSLVFAKFIKFIFIKSPLNPSLILNGKKLFNLSKSPMSLLNLGSLILFFFLNYTNIIILANDLCFFTIHF